ncbi:hypothetical protein AYJ58_16785 [Shewanella sp. Pdp11]|uniref:hypothetical protein n=1 Tax=Shewanella sp. Pdp11 TaxID=2059264 RepID=UPI000CA1E9B7|nr:hypothetical protein [Shewanella sp. Pdp11]AUD61023.1 hypothetical protein AYJ58_16785 [Shewanella sp. Pdp11]
MLSFIKQILKFDPVINNYAWSSMTLNRVGNFELFVPKGRAGLFIRLFLYIYKGIRSVSDYKFFSGYEISNENNSKLLFYYGSLNQFKALNPIVSKVRGMTISENRCADFKLQYFNCFLFSFLFLPITVLKLISVNQYVFNSFRFNLDGYLMSIGYYVEWLRVLNKLSPRAVIVSNDHNPSNRALISACKSLGIKTCFIQHAPAVCGFPALDYNLALLEGKHAIACYDVAPECNVKFVGSYISSHVNNNLSEADNVLFSTGLVSNINESSLVIKNILELNKRIILRPHPADPRLELWKQISNNHNISFSDPKLESPITALQSCNVVIGAMSGLLLESAVRSKAVYCFNGQNTVPDWYGLIENKVCGTLSLDNLKSLANIFDFENLVIHSAQCFKSASYYYENIGVGQDEYLNQVHNAIHECLL